MGKYFIFFTLFIFIGCGGKVQVESVGTPQSMNDLDQYMMTGLAAEIEDSTLDKNLGGSSKALSKTQMDIAQQDPCGDEVPEWTQKLHKEVQGHHNGIRPRTGEGKRRKRGDSRVQSDLVRPEDCEPDKKDHSSVAEVTEEDQSSQEKIFSDLNGNEQNSENKQMSGKEKIDLLMVLDNSYSMRSILKSNDLKFAHFLDKLKPFDWRVAFLDSQPTRRGKKKLLMPLEMDGALVLNRRYITKQTRSKNRLFIDTITKSNKQSPCRFSPGCGTSQERVLKSLSQYLLFSKMPDTGSRFMRPDADLVVLIITDSHENRTIRERQTTAQSFLQTFGNHFEGKNLTVHSFTVLSSKCQRQIRKHAGEGYFAPEVTLLTKKTDGSSFSICSDDYSVVADTIIQNRL